MKTFEMLYPPSVRRAIEALGADDSKTKKILAGGQDLLGELKDHLEEPDVVVNLKSVANMDVLDVQAGTKMHVLGAMTTLGAIERDAGVQALLPMLAEAANAVATPQIRNAGTLGGNLCQRPRCFYYRNEHANCLKKGGTECFSFEGLNKYNAILGGGPSYIVHPSDVAPALIAYDARINLATSKEASGVRSLPLEEFYILPADGNVTRETVMEPTEFVTSILVPERSGWRATYLKLRERDSFDFALSAVALALRMDGDKIAEARLVLGGVAPKPWRSHDAEKAIVGKTIDDATAKLAGDEALRLAEPPEQNGYKIPMTKGLITKAFRKLANA